MLSNVRCILLPSSRVSKKQLYSSHLFSARYTRPCTTAQPALVRYVFHQPWSSTTLAVPSWCAVHWRDVDSHAWCAISSGCFFICEHPSPPSDSHLTCKDLWSSTQWCVFSNHQEDFAVLSSLDVKNVPLGHLLHYSFFFVCYSFPPVAISFSRAVITIQNLWAVYFEWKIAGKIEDLSWSLDKLMRSGSILEKLSQLGWQERNVQTH